MKKRVFSFLMAICMVFALLPVTALAAGTTIKNVDITISIPTLGQSKESMPTDAKVVSPAGIKVTQVGWSGEYVNGKTAEGQAYSAGITIEIDGADAKFAKSSLAITVNGVKCTSVYRKSDTRVTVNTPLSLCRFEKPQIAANYKPDFLPESQGSYDTFDYRAYANIYPDLKAAYGYDAQKLYAHYVNYGKDEGRVGTFISGSNPKSNAPLYGIVPGTASGDLNYTWDGKANVPATLLDPLPPTKSSQLDKWRMEGRTAIYWMSNAKLVAEWNHAKTYMTDDRPGSYKTEAVEVWTLQTIPYELEIRCAAAQTVYDYEHGVRNDYVDAESYQDAKNSPEYQRAAASDVTILFQWDKGFKSLPAPPADPGVAGQKPVPTVGGFSDVFENNYFAQPVVWAVNQKIASGTSTTTFSPDQTCTQAQILTFLWRAAGSPKPQGTVEMEGFDGTEYYYQAAMWAAEQDMVEGKFNPETPCTRAMAVTFMWKHAGSPSAASAGFTDVPASADYAQAVAWAVEKGVTSGTGDNQFSPSQTCTRGQIAAFLYRAFAN